MPLALVFAEAARRADAWRPALEGLNVIEPQIVKEWTEEARNEGIKEGRLGGRRETLLPFLRRLGPVPADLEQALRAVKYLARLDAITAALLSSATLDDFRRAVNL